MVITNIERQVGYHRAYFINVVSSSRDKHVINVRLINSIEICIIHILDEVEIRNLEVVITVLIVRRLSVPEPR